MSTLAIIGMALGLALDAFAVCLGVGAAGHAAQPRPAVRLSFHFGLFQFLMPVVGWLAGVRLEQLITSVGPWVAFALLVGVGGRMVHAGFNPQAKTYATDPTRGLTMVLLSLAVSLDALAVGISLALVGITIWQPSLIIGLVTGTLSLLGIALGTRLGERFGKRMELVGGALLIFIGLQILL